jgi:hypothetical protein
MFCSHDFIDDHNNVLLENNYYLIILYNLCNILGTINPIQARPGNLYINILHTIHITYPTSNLIRNQISGNIKIWLKSGHLTK